MRDSTVLSVHTRGEDRDTNGRLRARLKALREGRGLSLDTLASQCAPRPFAIAATNAVITSW